MAETFPESLDLAVNSLVNTLVNKIITREDDDGLEEFIALTGIHSANDVEIRNYATAKAEEIWGPYKKLPLPSAFDPAIRNLADARAHLADKGITQLKDAELFSVNALVPVYMKAFETNQAGWRGATIDAVRSYYLGRWGGMTFLQSNTLALLTLILQAYREQVARAQEDVVELVKRAEQVVASYDPGSLCNSADSKNMTFNIAIGVLSVLSAGAGVASWGLTSILTAVAAAGLGVAKDAYNPEAPKDADMGGSSVAEIWQSVLDATDKLRKQFTASDGELNKIVQHFHDEVINGKVTVGKSGKGEPETLPALELMRSKELGSTSDIKAPLNGSDNPDPAHSPQR